MYRGFGYRELGVFAEQGRLDGQFVDVMAMENILKPSVLFVCPHNTGRSQMAEAYLRRLLGERVDVASAGTIPDDHPSAGVVAAMAEVGVDISQAPPKLIDPLVMVRADRIITMGCAVEGLPHIDDDWALPDPTGQAPERVREIRDLILEKAQRLAEKFVGPVCKPNDGIVWAFRFHDNSTRSQRTLS